MFSEIKKSLLSLTSFQAQMLITECLCSTEKAALILPYEVEGQNWIIGVRIENIDFPLYYYDFFEGTPTTRNDIIEQCEHLKFEKPPDRLFCDGYGRRRFFLGVKVRNFVLDRGDELIRKKVGSLLIDKNSIILMLADGKLELPDPDEPCHIGTIAGRSDVELPGSRNCRYPIKISNGTNNNTREKSVNENTIIDLESW